MPWFYRNNAIRASELNTIAYMLWKRRSTDPDNLLEVRLVDPQDKRSAFVVMRQNKASQPIHRPQQVQRYIRKFYTDLLYSDGNAPNDVFLDSMNNVTAKQK